MQQPLLADSTPKNRFGISGHPHANNLNMFCRLARCFFQRHLSPLLPIGSPICVFPFWVGRFLIPPLKVVLFER